MATQNDTKLKKMLGLHKLGTVLLAAWLERQGISRNLQKHYRRSGWLESVGTGAFKRQGEAVTWQGGLFALQTEADTPIHAGAMTALGLQGFAHYARYAQDVYLFSPRGTRLASWFKHHEWGVAIRHFSTSVLPDGVGLLDRDEKNFVIRISGLERAMLECLHLAPQEFDLVECFQIMEGLTGLRPDVVQELLRGCTSVKAKRLFLYMAERANHSWLSFVDVSTLDLGSGGRSFAKGGAYVPKYNLVVPQELAAQ
jgi:hypothetical protein